MRTASSVGKLNALIRVSAERRNDIADRYPGFGRD